MRTISFKEVLWSVAYKFGFDPEQSNFMTNQALPIGNYIREWVRRAWSAKDFPEWVQLHQFAPDTRHIVKWKPLAIDLQPPDRGPIHAVLVEIGRPLEVFITDPRITEPVDTPFTEYEEGIHVGYEHGQSVYIKYMPPAPKLTAETWKSTETYSKDDVRYSSRTGECYKSKVNNNRGHDPADENYIPSPPDPFIPPGPPGKDGPPPIKNEITQDRIPDDPGLAERNQILVIDFDKFKVSQPQPTIFHISDPPELDSSFYVDIFDEDGTLLGEGGPITANGTDTLSAIMASLAAALATDLGGTFVVTSDQKSIIVENNSVFKTGHAFYRPALGYPYYFPSPIVNQSYVPSKAGATGQPQTTQMTMTPAQVMTGATYWLVFRGPDGIEHEVQYTATSGDSAPQILAGLSAAIEAARLTDDYFNDVSPKSDPVLLTLDIDTRDVASIDSQIRPPVSKWWEIVRIPEQLADQVIRGATADLFKEWGQTDKGFAEEQVVPLEQKIATDRIGDVEPMLTNRQRALSRYKIEGEA